MNKNTDKDISRRVKKALTEDLSSIDEGVVSELEAARYRALEGFDRQTQAHAFFDKPTMIPGLIFACSLFVVVGVWFVQQPSERSEGHAYDEQAVLYRIDTREISSTELELVEDLEFYEWLDSNGYAG